MLERNMERLRRDNGAIVQVYQTPRRRRFYTVLVTFPDGTQTTRGGFAAQHAAWEWGIKTADGHKAT